MFNLQKDTDREEHYRLMAETARSILEDETDLIAALANLSAVINEYLDDINWAGFYLIKGKDLVLGPFQGFPACSRIGEGKGVCGRAALERKPVIVPNVQAFPGHIVCDSRSASEIVLPIFKGEAVFGVLDVDSPRAGRFSALEERYLNQICQSITAFLERIPF
jgi:GAF domain-containing protein